MTSNRDSLYMQLAHFLIEHPDYVTLPYRRVLALAMEAGGLPHFTYKVLHMARRILPEDMRIERHTVKDSQGKAYAVKGFEARFIIDMRRKTVRYEGLVDATSQWDMHKLKHFTPDMHGVNRLLKLLIAAGYSKTSVGRGRDESGAYAKGGDAVIVMRKVRA